MPPGAVVTDFGDLFGRYSRLIGGAVVIPKPPGDGPGQTDDSERHEYHPPTEYVVERHEQHRGVRAAEPTGRPDRPLPTRTLARRQTARSGEHTAEPQSPKRISLAACH